MRRLIAPATAAAALLIAACGGTATSSTSATHSAASARRRAATSVARAAAARKRARDAVPYARLLGSAQGSAASGFVPVAVWRGQTAAWLARSPSGVALLSFDQSLLELTLHSGTIDAGPTGWRHGPEVAGSELKHLVAAFNGGFKFSTLAGGFMSYGRLGAPLRAGLGSIVTYSNGYTDIGAWDRELPAGGKRVISVRQNLTLLIDHGRAAASVDCLTCWGATLGGVSDPARSALGVTADGRLIWAGTEHATVAALADTLLSARVVRAVELDINPEWVAAYLYGHGNGHSRVAPVPVVTGQPGVPGQFLAPYSRDFFTLATR